MITVGPGIVYHINQMITLSNDVFIFSKWDQNEQPITLKVITHEAAFT